jgi:hypothetical protein
VSVESVTIVWHIALKSASPQVFFFVAPQRKLRFSNAQLAFFRFKLLDTTFNRNLYELVWYGEILLIGSYSVVVKSNAW